ncbi:MULTISPECIES: aldo/keto reductase [Halocynthiibacter]|uniref:Aldo/keto reductase n=1 Tax=Halocynthiibacter halioticoli TaxID=2986804 RepID=A0AAE3LUN5_9RHOB|nr:MULTISPECIES: aldo/keto reductase [Halocynthiibacter]MCV6824985.1 aldo/keto reductase [Halocynthiibacter halioticoli]MCW4057986.1 aldo/keto reductase [Halocynthiibacter sp. SDUM655004]
MKKIKLGRSDIEVTQLCLGTMTWGTQNTEAEGHAQIDYAAEQGINFMDTAEMYPVNPVSKETVGNTESIIGTWIAKNRNRRDDWVIATKIAGLNGRFVREDQPITGETMKAAVESSLKRLQTDVIDLYQIHWPNRGSYHFRQYWDFDASGQNRQETLDHMADVLRAMDELQKAGKVREFGLSNESAWGTAQWLRLADELSAPRMQTIQNEYSLLCRLFDTDLAELCVNEDVTLLAYSPLGCGLLTGKYDGGETIPKGSRLDLNGDLGGRVTPKVWPAVEAYLNIARKHDLDPSQMAIAWCMTRPFPISPIFGATSVEQLKVALGSDAVELSDEVLRDIKEAYREFPMPV